MKIRICSVGEGELLTYARRELTYFLTQYSNHQMTEDEDAQREIVLIQECGNGWDSDMTYRIAGSERKGKKIVTVTSGSSGGILSGVYAMLEHMGLCFRMNGPVINGLLDIAAWDGDTEECRPFVKYRGVRQHINFPMDISSYHLEEAQEYIRNLARMGMNSITFHSYTGQWHGYETDGNVVYAGNYFYGQRHMVPEDPVIREHVANRKYYCIPEIEGQISDMAARHEFSIWWLNQVMKTCRQVGLHIIMSIELPEDESLDTLVKIVHGVLESYPLIDTIEWISPEGGGEGEPFHQEELLDKVRVYFGDAPFESGNLSFLPENMPGALPGAMMSLKRAVDLYGRREEIFEGMEKKQIAIGLYVMCRDTLRFLKQIMVSALPKEVLLTFLSAHGSLAVAENIAYMDFTKEELKRTMLYSWMEFDGNMYLQQNSNKGIESLLKCLKGCTGGEPVYGIGLNHWRTAENEVVAGYAAKTLIHFKTAAVFYKEYADKLGIRKSGDYADAMVQLEEIDCYNRDNLFNIGFCYLGCWLAPLGVGWIRGWDKEDMLQSIHMYTAVITSLEKCLDETVTVSGIAELRFLINRISCSILQIRCILALKPVCEMAGDTQPQLLTAVQKEQVEQQCDQAMDYCRQDMERHVEQIVDRGCQGTLVSYCATIPVYVDHVRQYFVQGEEICRHKPDSFDAPPPPDGAYLA